MLCMCYVYLLSTTRHAMLSTTRRAKYVDVYMLSTIRHVMYVYVYMLSTTRHAM